MRSILSVSIGTTIINPAPTPLPCCFVRAIGVDLVVCARLTCFGLCDFDFLLIKLCTCCELGVLWSMLEMHILPLSKLTTFAIIKYRACESFF
jgi:hypothetical protein